MKTLHVLQGFAEKINNGSETELIIHDDTSRITLTIKEYSTESLLNNIPNQMESLIGKTVKIVIE